MHRSVELCVYMLEYTFYVLIKRIQGYSVSKNL